MRFEYRGYWYEIRQPTTHRWYPGMRPWYGGRITVTEYEDEEEWVLINRETFHMAVGPEEVENWSDAMVYLVSESWYPAMELGWELDRAPAADSGGG